MNKNKMTRKIRMATILLTLTLITSTISFAQTGKKKSIKTKTQSSAMANLDWQGKYFGITPCASCDGIETTLTLAKGNNFRLTTLYIRTTEKLETINGKFKWNGNKIVLQNIKSGTRPTMFKVEENQIKQLDLKGNEIKGELWGAYVLKKMGNTEVENKRWKLIELNGNPIKENAETHYIIFHSPEGNLEAKAGCNQIANTYEIKNNTQLKITAGFSTLMACPEGNVENEFKEALLNADNLSINNKTLSLNKSRMAPLARFEFAENLGNSWFIGKTFIQQGITTNDPELGGNAFLKFNTKTNVSLKTGDIVAQMTASFEGDEIILEDKSLNISRTFTVINNEYLQDEKGIKWIVK